MKSAAVWRCCVAILWAAFCLAEFRPRSCDASSPEQSGTIEGTVTYRADSKRPWRYGRYYIQRSRTGELAEAVVALRSRKATGAETEPHESTATIDQKDYQFLPETTAIRAGTLVTFTNSDYATHNVHASGAIGDFNITIPAGGSHTVRCNLAGGIRQPIQVGCVFHSAMQAWIFVFDHPHFQVTKTDGRFQLENVPPGQYYLEMVHPAGQLRWRQRIDVRPGETQQINIAVSPDDKK